MLNASDKLPDERIKPTAEEIMPPIPICIKPNNAEALPAFFENGFSAIDAALG